MQIIFICLVSGCRGGKSNSVVAVVLSLLEYYIEFGLMRFLFQLFHRLPFENILLI